ncbi:hypothetical protein M3Y96_00295100 [Aphelenchoides besseyi]|nr:hypothetical protein M3Y96_00295100 [Aphelenchoides besseyi]
MFQQLLCQLFSLSILPVLLRAQQWGDYENGNFMPMNNYGGCGSYGSFHSLPNHPNTNGPSDYGENSNGLSSPYSHNVIKQVLKNLPALPPGSNTTLIPLGQVLIPTGKEICCCNNGPNGQINSNNGMNGNGGMNAFGMNTGAYGSSMGMNGNEMMQQNCNNGYSNNGGYGGQMSGNSNCGDYSGSCGDGCCPCCFKRKRRSTGRPQASKVQRKLKKLENRLHSRHFH